MDFRGKGLGTLLFFIVIAHFAYAQKNILKFGYNLFSPVYSYERVLQKKLSLNIDVAYSKNAQMSVVSDIPKAYPFQVIALVPQLRFYTTEFKKAPNGFYIAPYLKYRNISARFTETYTLIENEAHPLMPGTNANVNVETTIDFVTLGGGFQFGVQFTIARFVDIDFWYLCLGGNQNILSASFYSPDEFPEGYGLNNLSENLTKPFNKSPWMPNDFTLYSRDESLIMEYNYLFVDYRIGVTLGLRF